MPIRISIYEDNQPLRDALSLLVETTVNFELAGAHGHCQHLEKQISTERPDVILMDIDLPGISGIQATLWIHQKYPRISILMLSVFDDDAQVFEAIKAGASGYILKKTSPSRILDAIREIYEGGAPMSPDIARRVIASFHKAPGNRDMDELSSRELSILSLLALGKSYKMVSSEAGISINTTRTYIKRIYEKLHVHSVTEAIARYLAEGPRH